jgi:hypothetical protein
MALPDGEYVSRDVELPPFGASTQLWGTTHNPQSKKNFGYLMWRKRNCVFL